MRRILFTVTWVTALLVVVAVLSVIAGWAAEGWYSGDFSWEVAGVVGTALGTTTLALATLVLALGTREIARTAEAQVAVEQNALAASFRPLLLNVPFGATLPPGLEDFALHSGDSDFVRVRVVPLDDGEPDRGHEVSMPVRNAGVGVAFITGVFVEWKGERRDGHSRNAILPPGEITGLYVSLPYDADLDSPGDWDRLFVVEVVYEDLGANDWQTRIDVRWRDAGGWQTRALDHRRVGAPDEQAVLSGDMLEW